MAKPHPERRLFELLLEVASPTLIIAMVASLVFFLIEILYRGPHVLRLNVIMALFTIATVLISRISIQSGEERAALFAGGLAVATLATTSVIVEFRYQQLAWLEPVVILSLIATVMWVSNRLVWDCTLIGPRRDVSAMGLTEVIRQKLSVNKNHKRERVTKGKTKADADTNTNANASSRDTNLQHQTPDSHNSDSPSTTPFNFFHFLLGRNGRNTTPGLWVFYLAMAAFPIFGIGQWFYEPGGNGFSIFFLFLVYLSTGLGLLMVTSLLGLKRYVDQRGITIPDAIAMNWLFIGTIFLAGFLLLSLLIPRPDVSSTVKDYLALFNRQTQTADIAAGNDNEAQDKPADNVQPKREDRREKNRENGNRPPADQNQKIDGPNGSNDGDKKFDDQKGSDSGKGKGQSQGKGNDQSKIKDQNNDKSNNEKSQPQGNDQKNDTPQNADAQDPGEPKDPGKPKGPGNPKDPADNPADENASDPAPAKDPTDAPDNAAAGENADDPPARRGQRGQQPQPPQPPRLDVSPDSGQSVVLILAAACVGVILFLYRQQIAEMWRLLFKGRPKSDPAKNQNSPATFKRQQRIKPFAAYADPFASATARQMAPQELMDYSLSALRAFARQHDVASSADLTVEELATAIARSFSAQDEHGRNATPLNAFAAAFNRTIYGSGTPSPTEMESVKRLWRFMTLNATPNAKANAKVPSNVASNVPTDAG